MNIFKKIIIVLIGTFIIGLGIAFTKFSNLGLDCLAALVYSFHYWIDIPFFTYGVCYIIINSIFCILVLIFLKGKIKLGSIINFVLTGFCVDICVFLLTLIKLETNIFIIRVLYSLIGISFISFGVALYGGVSFGLAPYDALPMLISKVFPKIKYGVARMIIALVLIFISLIIGVLILRRSDIININTLLASMLLSIQIPIFSKFINNRILKTNDHTFE